jgi:DNA-binding response OmpR family regulator
MRVLIVDDNSDVAAMLSEILELIGHETCVALSAAEALEIASDRRPDLVLLDLGLPDRPGEEVAQGLRRLPGGDRMQIVALTGRPDVVLPGDAFDGRLLKPVGVETLRELTAGPSPCCSV